MEQAVIYETTAVVNSESVEDYENYMRNQHIPDLLATGHFRAASFIRAHEICYRICYEAFNQSALDNYLNNDAPRLRADFQKHFPEGVEISREVWTVLQSWQADS